MSGHVVAQAEAQTIGPHPRCACRIMRVLRRIAAWIRDTRHANFRHMFWQRCGDGSPAAVRFGMPHPTILQSTGPDLGPFPVEYSNRGLKEL